MAGTTVSTAILTAFVLVLTVVPARGFNSGNETLLRATVFNGYDSEVRPEEVTHVVLTFNPTSLSAIDIKLETMEITGWWTLSWNDSRLTWDPATYDNIGETHVFQHEIWTPPIIVYNSIDNLSAIDEQTIPIRISNAGTILWSPPGILKVSCSTDITFFPFDTQTCGILITTFGYTISELSVTPIDMDTTFYTPSGEWVLERMYTESSPALYSFVSFQFVFKRKPAYYGLNLLLPVIMLWVLSIFIFLLPAESGEKMGYSLTVLLAFVVLMTLLSDTMPTTADHVSFLEVYIILVLTFCGLSVGYSILSLAIYFHQEDEPVPGWLSRFTVWVQKKSGRAVRKIASQTSVDDDHPLPRKHRWSDTQSSSSESDEVKVKVSWKEAAIALDCVVFRVYVCVTTLLTVVFLIVMAAR